MIAPSSDGCYLISGNKLMCCESNNCKEVTRIDGTAFKSR